MQINQSARAGRIDIVGIPVPAGHVLAGGSLPGCDGGHIGPIKAQGSSGSSVGEQQVVVAGQSGRIVPCSGHPDSIMFAGGSARTGIIEDVIQDIPGIGGDCTVKTIGTARGACDPGPAYVDAVVVKVVGTAGFIDPVYLADGGQTGSSRGDP